MIVCGMWSGMGYSLDQQHIVSVVIPQFILEKLELMMDVGAMMGQPTMTLAGMQVYSIVMDREMF